MSNFKIFDKAYNLKILRKGSDYQLSILGSRNRITLSRDALERLVRQHYGLKQKFLNPPTL